MQLDWDNNETSEAVPDKDWFRITNKIEHGIGKNVPGELQVMVQCSRSYINLPKECRLCKVQSSWHETCS